MSAIRPACARRLLSGFLITLAISLGTLSSARAGATCVARTADGGSVRLQIVHAGTMGGFEKATLTIYDADGNVRFRHNFDRAGQHAAVLHRDRAVVVFRGLSGDADVFLTFVGKNHDSDQLEKALDDPDREKDAGNTLRISIYREGQQKEYTLRDIVCRLHSEE